MPQIAVGVSTATGSSRGKQPCTSVPEPTLAAVQPLLAMQAAAWPGPPSAGHPPVAWRVACQIAEQELLLAAASPSGRCDQVFADAAWLLPQLLHPCAAPPLHSELHANPPQTGTDQAGRAAH